MPIKNLAAISPSPIGQRSAKEKLLPGHKKKKEKFKREAIKQGFLAGDKFTPWG